MNAKATTAGQLVEESNRNPWALGDFHVIGVEHTLCGELLCEDSGLGADSRVLDVACGSGNTALAAARRRSSVTGVDFVDKLLERGRLRATAEGLSVNFVAGNCEQLPFDDGSFDYVLSTFGAMFARDQERAAEELLRCCRPGGTIGLANWTPESMPGALFALSAKHGASQPGAPSPIEWGTVPGLQRLFGKRALHIRLVDRCVHSRFSSFEQWLSTFRQYFGPMRMLFQSIPQQQWPQVEEELRQTLTRYNRATDGTLAVSMSYVNVVMIKK